jgi:hypothetical protein
MASKAVPPAANLGLQPDRQRQKEAAAGEGARKPEMVKKAG